MVYIQRNIIHVHNHTVLQLPNKNFHTLLIIFFLLSIFFCVFKLMKNQLISLQKCMTLFCCCLIVVEDIQQQQQQKNRGKIVSCDAFSILCCYIKYMYGWYMFFKYWKTNFNFFLYHDNFI